MDGLAKDMDAKKWMGEIRETCIMCGMMSPMTPGGLRE